MAPLSSAREALDEFEASIRRVVGLISDHVQPIRRTSKSSVTLEPPEKRAVRLRDDLFLWFSYTLELVGDQYTTIAYQLIIQSVEPYTRFQPGDTTWLVRWEYHPDLASTQSPHIHVNGQQLDGWDLPDGLSGLHVIAGRTLLEDVVEFAIAAFDVCKQMDHDKCQSDDGQGNPSCRCLQILEQSRINAFARRQWMNPPKWGTTALPRRR